MATTAITTLSQDLHSLADEATDHLKDAARKTGADATEALTRATHTIARAAGHLREQVEQSATRGSDQVSASAKAHPIVAGATTSVLFSVVAALAATFALVRLSQS